MAGFIEAHHGKVLLGTRVEKILTKDGAAYGVTTADKQVYKGRVVVSNADAWDTFHGMLEPTADLANLNDYLARMDRFTPSLWSFIVFLGLKRDLVGKAGLGDTEVFYETGYDPEAGYRQLLEADMTNPGFGAMFYDNLYKGYSPAGKNTLTLVTLQGFDHWKKHEKDYWAGHKDAYRAEKERMANILIRQGGSAPARAFQGDRGQRDRYAADQCAIHRQLSRRNLRLGPDPGQFQPAAPAACDAGSESVPLRRLDELRRRLQRRVGERPGVFRRDHGALATLKLKPSFARRGWWMCHLIWKWPISIHRLKPVPPQSIASRTIVRKGTPVGPLARNGLPSSSQAVPAISRCTHGVGSANSFRNMAAVTAPP